jgi:hypothetical protein
MDPSRIRLSEEAARVTIVSRRPSSSWQLIAISPARTTISPWPICPTTTIASPAAYDRRSPKRRMRSISRGVEHREHLLPAVFDQAMVHRWHGRGAGSRKERNLLGHGGGSLPATSWT